MKTTQAPLLALLALLCVPALGQDETPPPPAMASVRVHAVKAMGKRKKDAKPAIPPELDAVKATLTKTPYDRFESKSQSKGRTKAGAENTFDLPEGYSAKIVWNEGKQGEIVLDVTLERAKADKPPKKVASMKVALKDGASYLLKCPAAYADGDLLLVITASRKRL